MLRRSVGSVSLLAAASRLRFTRRMQSSCPMSAAPTATATATAVETPTTSCPFVGTAPDMHCPMEEETQRKLPFTAIVSQCGKSKLSAFVTATAVAGYVMAGGMNPVAIAALTVGTMFQSCSANTMNQVIEVNYDKLMKRTCKRPLVTKQISRPQGFALSSAELAIGTGILAAVSPLAAGLGVFNWFLYVGMYTPLKRVSATNTWFGALVGGIPPLMGGVCASGGLMAAGVAPAYLLGAVMLVWQIPHFMALSFHCRRDYEGAGYKMLAFSNPWRASFYAIATAVLMAAITLFGPHLIDMPVELWYYPVVFAINATMIMKSVRFHMDPVRNCRSCFVFSYVYLAVILGVYCVNHVQPVAFAVNAASQLSTSLLLQP